MRILITFILVIFSGRSLAQDSMYIQYEKRSELLLNKLNVKTISDSEKTELKAIAFGFQNHGFLLDESYHDFSKSLAYVNKAIDLFIALKDTSSQANNLKFKGYLLGMLNDFPGAKMAVGDAIHLFEACNFLPGVAVSRFDLSRVYEHENNLDSAICFCNISLDFWKSKNNTWRIFNVQTMLVNLLIKSGQFEKALAVQKEADFSVNKKEIDSRSLADYYLLLSRLYKAIHKTNMEARYEKLYQIQLADLNGKEKSFRSYYGTL